MRLSDLVKRDLSFDPQIEGVTADSRKVRPGFLFAALPGSAVDGSLLAHRWTARRRLRYRHGPAAGSACGRDRQHRP